MLHCDSFLYSIANYIFRMIVSSPYFLDKLFMILAFVVMYKVLIRSLLQRGILVSVKSITPKRIEENIEVSFTHHHRLFIFFYIIVLLLDLFDSSKSCKIITGLTVNHVLPELVARFRHDLLMAIPSQLFHRSPLIFPWQVFDFALTVEDMQEIAKLRNDHRFFPFRQMYAHNCAHCTVHVTLRFN